MYSLQEEGARDRHNWKINLNNNWFKNQKTPENDPIEIHKSDRLKPPPPQWLSSREKLEIGTKEVERPYEGVVFIPYTKEAILRKELQKVDRL